MNTELIDQYYDLVEEGADSANPQLAMLRERMSDAEVKPIIDWLRADWERLGRIMGGLGWICYRTGDGVLLWREMDEGDRWLARADRREAGVSAS